MLLNGLIKHSLFIVFLRRKFRVLAALGLFILLIRLTRDDAVARTNLPTAYRHEAAKPDMNDTTIELKAPVPTETSPEFSWKPYRVHDVDCSKLFTGDKTELKLVKTVKRYKIPDEKVSTYVSRGCDEFLYSNSFITEPVTTEERNYPIAYSIIAYKDAAQVLGLLRAIHRPQNFICIHVDHKSPATFRSAIADMISCLDNVFLSTRSVSVRWGTYSVLKAELICMEDLLQFKGWKYFINLTGQEFPLKTNLQIVAILKALRGANLFNTSRRRWQKRWQNQLPAPYNLTIRKGSLHMAVNRHFVQYVITSPVGRAFSEWCKRIRIPDEEFFISLSINPQLGIPGTYTGTLPQRLAQEASVIRFKNWRHLTKSTPCSGSYTRSICILTVGDLPLLDKRRELFANKFHMDSRGILAMECLTEKLHNRSRDEALGTTHFDVSWYRSLAFLKRIIRVPP